jgi:hypothetical protein
MVNSEDSKTRFYVQQIRNNNVAGEYKIQHYLEKMGKTKKRIALAQLRTGYHWLGVELGRWQGLDREERKCQRCAMQVVDDEQHMVFHCSKFNNIREEYSELFEGVEIGNVHQFLNNNEHSLKIAEFVFKCKEICSGDE